MTDVAFLEEIIPGKPPGNDFSSTFGCKSYGLTRIPANWRPAGLAISIGAYRRYRASGTTGVQSFFSEHWHTIAHWIDRAGGHGPLLMRSSGANETVQDRGRYLSVLVEISSVENLATELARFV